MKKNKTILYVIILTCFLTLLMGCNRGNVENENSVSQDKLDKLPDYQKDDEINKELVKLREERKKNYKSDSTGHYSGTNKMEGDLIDIPVNEEEIEKISKVSDDYVRNTLKISDELGLEEPTACIDNRMLKIYEDEDKGVANGYDNENIYIDEYEYENGKYKYLIIVRKDKNSPWQVIYNGLNYKNE